MIGPGFKKRTLSVGRLLLALLLLGRQMHRLLSIYLLKKRLRPVWREALWLAVTEVNGCHFCSYIHSGMAGGSGLTEDDVALLLASGDVSRLSALDDTEARAVAYAKIWAESAGHPPKTVATQLRQDLSERQWADLHALLELIDFANRSGNTLESLLDRFRHPHRLIQVFGFLSDLVVGLLVALFGWPALVVGAIQRLRNRRRESARAA